MLSIYTFRQRLEYLKQKVREKLKKESSNWANQMPEKLNDDVFSGGNKKLFQFPTKLNEWMEGKNPIPIALEIQPSEICNHRCPLCQGQYALGRKKAKEKSRSMLSLT